MFENRTREALEISTAIERKLIALGIDKGDTLAMADLAREALNPAKLNEERVKAERCKDLLPLQMFQQRIKSCVLRNYMEEGGRLRRASR